MHLYFFDFPFGSPIYDESITLRNDMLRKPLGLEFLAEDLSLEYNDIHFGAFNSSMELLACLVFVRLSSNVVKMRQVAVQKQLQRKGIGKALVSASEIYCKEKGYKKIELNARDIAVPFYLILDYKKIGDTFTEVGIPHFKMYKDI